MKPHPETPNPHSAAGLQVLTLGAAEVWVNGQPADWHAGAAEELFFYLLSYPEGRSKEEILDSLWGLPPDPAANNRFRVTLHRIRAALQNPEAVQEAHGRYRLAGEVLDSTDLHGFYQALQTAEAARDEAAKLSAYRMALGQYRGDYLPGVRADWVGQAREEHQTAYVQALLEVALIGCAHQDCAASAQSLAQALRTDPYVGENYHQRLMCCLSVVADKFTSIEYYRRFVRFLKEEVDDTPMPETRELAERIKQGEGVCPFHPFQQGSCPLTHDGTSPHAPIQLEPFLRVKPSDKN